MPRRKQKKTRSKKRSVKGPAVVGPTASPKSPLTEAWKSRVMKGAVRRGERQPGRSS
jgi:hypothetical protein